jgi:adenosylcobyric acid synthase
VTERNGVASEDFDGAKSEDGRVMGTYFHGFFDHPEVRAWFLRQLDSGYEPASASSAAADPFELLAAHFAENLDLDTLFGIAGIERGIA